MMSRFLPAAGVLLASWPAAAGGFGCAGDCYREAWVPPTYAVTAERFIARAPRTLALVTPPEYGHVRQTVMVDPGSRRWVVSRDAFGRKVGCWVTTPPRFETVTRRVVVRAPGVIPYAQGTGYAYRFDARLDAPGHRAWVPAGY